MAGTTGILTALIRRAEQGGSYTVDVSFIPSKHRGPQTKLSVQIALNYYSRWLVDNVGTYPEDVWQDVWKRNGSLVFRHYNNMAYTIPRMMKAIMQSSESTLFRPEFFTQYHCKYLNADMRIVAPVLQFPDGEVKPEYHVGTRGNGVDQPHWPIDLSVEVVE